jgi:hypothetical protein
VIWLFLAVVLILVVIHPTFRRVAAWIAAGLVVLGFVAYFEITKPEPCPWDKSVAAGTDACGAANPANVSAAPPPAPAANALDSLPPPYTGKPVVPCADLPDNLRAGSNCTNAPWKEYAVPVRYTLDCPVGQIHAQDSLTGLQSCYDPHDPAQLARHLGECKGQPGDPHAGFSTIVTDTRGIPCNPRTGADPARNR